MRLASGLWVAAYLQRLRLSDIPAFVVRRGDETAGAVFVKLSTLDGRARCFHRTFDALTGARRWVEHSAGTDAEIEAACQAQTKFDPDIWIVEVEDRAGRHLLDEPGLNE